jgi:hypothetical protein
MLRDGILRHATSVARMRSPRGGSHGDGGVADNTVVRAVSERLLGALVVRGDDAGELDA